MKTDKRKYLIAAYFILCFAFCFYRALKGFCWSDESFYISTADRFLRGDVLMKQEWYRTQMSSVICLPFYALYLMVTGGNDGVVLFFRMLFLALSFSTAILYFFILKKEYKEKVALVAATLIMFYAHLNVTTLSYYMMSLEFLLIALILIYDYWSVKSKTRLCVAGFFLALSVLSLPSLVVSYFAIVAVLLLIICVGKIKSVNENVRNVIKELDLFNIILYTGIGIAVPAVVFLIYMFSRMNIQEMIESIPFILIDNEHNFTLGFLVRKFFRSIKEVYGGITNIFYCLTAICFLFQKFLKKKPYADLIVLFDLVLFVVYVIKSAGHTGYIQAAFCMFALPVFLLTNKKNHKLFWLYSSWGMLMAVTYCFSSSDFLYVMAIGFFVIAIACVCFLYDYVRKSIESDEKEEGINKSLPAKYIRMIVGVALPLAAVYVCCVTVGLRMTNVYRDAPMPRLTAKITEGPAKGLYTTDEHLEYYEDIMQVIEENCMATEGAQKIMFSKLLPWGYLCTDMRCAYPTTWRTSAYTREQLENYYRINPDNLPDVILVLKEYYGSYDACGDVEDDHTPNVDELNDFWTDYMRDDDMQPTEVKCGTVYTKR